TTSTAATTNTPTSTATPTPTQTATTTATAFALGVTCTSNAQCASKFCAPDGVCCDAPCNQPNQSCTLPGNIGLCTAQSAAVPAASDTGVMIVSLVLAMLGVANLRRAFTSQR